MVAGAGLSRRSCTAPAAPPATAPPAPLAVASRRARRWSAEFTAPSRRSSTSPPRRPARSRRSSPPRRRGRARCRQGHVAARRHRDAPAPPRPRSRRAVTPDTSIVAASTRSPGSRERAAPAAPPVAACRRSQQLARDDDLGRRQMERAARLTAGRAARVDRTADVDGAARLEIDPLPAATEVGGAQRARDEEIAARRDRADRVAAAGGRRRPRSRPCPAR